MDERLRRLRWRCRRGMRELDLLLMRYMDEVYPQASASEQAAFETLLSLQDPQIVALLSGRSRCDDAGLNALVERLLALH